MNLTRFEERVARAIMCAIFPDGGDPRITVSVGDMDLEGLCRYATREVPLKPALGFRVVIWICLFAPIFVLRRMKTFLDLTNEERDRVVMALISSSIYEVRALFVFFKAFTAVYYFTSTKLREEVTRSSSPEGEHHALPESGSRPIAPHTLVRQAVGGE
jgi:hypothetical protein